MAATKDSTDSMVRRWTERFKQSPLARETVTELKGRAQEIWRGTFELLRKESPEYRNAVDDEFTQESKSHCGELLDTIVGIAAGRSFGTDPFAFVRRHAEWRAQHQVPLVASLHAYRLAHKTYWTVTREPLNAHRKQKEALRSLSVLSEFWIELFEAVGAVLEEAHAAEEARIFAQNTQAHAQLIEELLAGIEPTGTETRQLLTLCGIRAGTKLCVAVVRRLAGLGGHSDGRHLDTEVANRSMVRLLNQVVPSSQFGKLVALRNAEVVLIAASAAGPAQGVAKILSRNGFNRRAPVAACGIGLEKETIASLPEALEEARLAVDLTNESRPLIRFSDIDLTEFVTRGAGRTATRLIPEWLRDSHRNGSERELVATIRAFADCSLNVKETAAKLGVHTNTVYFRLNQVKDRTGVDPRTFAGLSTLITALRILGDGRGLA